MPNFLGWFQAIALGDKWPVLLDLLKRGKIRSLVAKTYPLSAIAEAQTEFLAKKFTGKLVLIPPVPETFS
ncbi:zinc-binding dehydrogenase [Leucothrix pacifica]|uniref:Alcohol dehydrogenase-like C-terminal domain-containing protein n=1 Tax=Leucothrix pacifica TaxID=1247513 RepID=A0A317CIK3_9GAMM|nr:zinc-binding dehydrogenase [Leucothrix pacifica]PWQ96142.1 hypothetical protein DKW60_13380 [Leucothrix pacifica]